MLRTSSTDERSFRALQFEQTQVEHTRFHSIATLSAPSERRPAVHSHQQLKQHPLSNFWVLRGELPQESFAAFHASALNALACEERVATVFTFFETLDGAPFLVIAHQVATHQHRFVVMLEDPQAKAFLESILRMRNQPGRLGFELVPRDDNSPLVLQLSAGELPLDVYETLQSKTSAVSKKAKKGSVIRFTDLAQVMAVASHPELMSSLHQHCELRHISVSVVMPTMAI